MNRTLDSREEENNEKRTIAISNALEKSLEPINKRLDSIQETLDEHGETLKVLSDSQCDMIRHKLLKIYDANKENREITQDELHSFEKLYKSYKALGGNSFIDKIKAKVDEFDIN